MRTRVAIPVHNERKTLARVVGEVLNQGHPVLVVDDGSTDGSAAELDGFGGRVDLIRHPENLGYGRSLVDAFTFAAAHGDDWLLTLDGDEQHEPSQVAEFVRESADCACDILSGSRYLRPVPPGCDVPEDRRRINEIMTGELNRVLPFRLTDAFCGFKAYRVAALRRLRLSEPGYAMPVELWVQAAHFGLAVREIPVCPIYRDRDRRFGGGLDVPERRLAYYRDVLARALGAFPVGLKNESSCPR